MGTLTLLNDVPLVGDHLCDVLNKYTEQYSFVENENYAVVLKLKNFEWLCQVFACNGYTFITFTSQYHKGHSLLKINMVIMHEHPQSIGLSAETFTLSGYKTLPVTNFNDDVYKIIRYLHDKNPKLEKM